MFDEIRFGGTANRADPVFRDVFEPGAGRYSGIRFAHGRIINMATNGADVFAGRQWGVVGGFALYGSSEKCLPGRSC